MYKIKRFDREFHIFHQGLSINKTAWVMKKKRVSHLVKPFTERQTATTEIGRLSMFHHMLHWVFHHMLHWVFHHMLHWVFQAAYLSVLNTVGCLIFFNDWPFGTDSRRFSYLERHCMIHSQTASILMWENTRSPRNLGHGQGKLDAATSNKMAAFSTDWLNS